ncbi:RHS repeat-associated core domain-containing protein [Pseudomonas sp. CDFA 610]|uniref:RHS repeat-associated core domain-containing protein n=1 Tax=Pseudomonas sp. CDFA 610 TaxID=2829825 RepID=UPI001E437F06|nr:RHS repeat-associated core domain-containing protein [Pseudomonas sp. CDFA 610]MCD5982813.1 RHS repeat-associated core domain-containing protein [Pseudomonas sp. CDFA 610]
MASSAQTALCRYRYDALDRLAAKAPATDTEVQRFYQKNRLATEIQGAVQRHIFQYEDVLLAQAQWAQGEASTDILATDQHRSVLQKLFNAGLEPLAYMPYGHHPIKSGQASLPGFNGEPYDPVTGHYLLGNGYRAFNPVLMRFNSPDSLSPFEDGGLNAYAYCEGDPVNFEDPTGHVNIAYQRYARSLNAARPTVLQLNPQSMSIQRASTSQTPARVSTPIAVGQVGSGSSSTPPSALPQPSSSVPVAASSSGGHANSWRGNTGILSDEEKARIQSLLSRDISPSPPSTKQQIDIAERRFQNRFKDADALIRHYEASLSVEGRNLRYDSGLKRGLATAKSNKKRDADGYKQFMKELELRTSDNVRAVRQSK